MSMPREDQHELVDVLIIGAGVAGAAAALSAAREHQRRRSSRAPRILLVDREQWPREKVCGCCLGWRGIDALGDLGISREVLAGQSHTLSSAQIRSGARQLTLAHQGGVVISRASLDALIVSHAQAAGVHFAPRTSARVAPQRGDGAWSVQLTTPDGARHVRARIVIAADGLTGRSLDQFAELEPIIARSARMGLGACAHWHGVRDVDGSDALPIGRVVLCVGREGYVGLVRLPDGRVDIAAAVDPEALRTGGGPSGVIARLLDTSGLRPAGPMPEKFTGTGLLTRRRRRLALPGLLIAGDAAGYVEPFTGEGMSWGVCAGRAAGSLTATTPIESLASAWESWHAQNIRTRQRACQIVAAGLRWPRVFGAVLGAAGASGAVRSLAESVSRGISTDTARASERVHA